MTKEFKVEELLVEEMPNGIHMMGCFGNVWMRKLYWEKMSDEHAGHSHHHDHITMVTKGKVRVEIDGYVPRSFKAPTFFIVKAELHHKLIAEEDDTHAFCVFALRDENGEVTDLFDDNNSPYGHRSEE